MNDWGVNLKGKHGVMKAGIFYKPKASIAERTFVLEGGLGCDPTPNTPRKVTGFWLSDKAKDTLSSYDFEYLIINGKNVRPRVTGDPPPEPVMKVEEPEADEPQAKVRRKR